MFNCDKIWRSYSDFYLGVTFLEHSVYDSWSEYYTNTNEILAQLVVVKCNNAL